MELIKNDVIPTDEVEGSRKCGEATKKGVNPDRELMLNVCSKRVEFDDICCQKQQTANGFAAFVASVF